MASTPDKPPETFRKAPRRATSKGKRVIVSPDAKRAYEALMREKDERAAAERHLPPDMKR